MAKVVKKSGVKFDNIFVKDAPEAKKAMVLTDVLDEYIYETFNKSKEDMEASYGDKLVPSFHPSQLAKAFCVRKMVYEFLGAPFEGDLKFNPSLTHRIWHNGHGVHDRIQGYMAALGKFTDGKCVLIGRWKCPCGAEYGYKKSGKKEEGAYWVPRPDKCDSCGRDGRHILYKEAGVNIPHLRVKGKMDGVLVWKDEKWIVEIKSMNPYQYANLSAPPDYYIPQTDIYMMASGIHKTIWIFEDKATQNWREFLTHHDPKNIAKILDLLVKANKAIDSKTLPPKYKDQRSCRACEYRRICEASDEYKEW